VRTPTVWCDFDHTDNHTSYPANCPYLTTTGSTYLPRGANVLIDQERGTDRFPSGGGVSNIYPRPDWQDAAVSHFLEFYNTYPTYNISYELQPTAAQAGPGIFNRGGRGYPGEKSAASMGKTNLLTSRFRRWRSWGQRPHLLPWCSICPWWHFRISSYLCLDYHFDQRTSQSVVFTLGGN